MPYIKEANISDHFYTFKFITMKNILLAIALPVSLGATAQISKVTLQASGLTCSMCSNSINKSLRSVDYVEKVMANIKIPALK